MHLKCKEVESGKCGGERGKNWVPIKFCPFSYSVTCEMTLKLYCLPKVNNILKPLCKHDFLFFTDHTSCIKNPEAWLLFVFLSGWNPLLERPKYNKQRRWSVLDTRLYVVQDAGYFYDSPGENQKMKSKFQSHAISGARKDLIKTLVPSLLWSQLHSIDTCDCGTGGWHPMLWNIL